MKRRPEQPSIRSRHDALRTLPAARGSHHVWDAHSDIAAGTGLAAEAALHRWPDRPRHCRRPFTRNGREGAPAPRPCKKRVGRSMGRRFRFQTKASMRSCAVSDSCSSPTLSGLAEFRRVLSPGGRAAVSVNTVPERSYNIRINLAIARHVPSLAEAAARVFSLGDEMKLRYCFGLDFRDVEITTETHRFALPSFDAYFEPIEQGAGSSGQAFVPLSEEVRHSCARKCGAISATKAGQSRSKWNTVRERATIAAAPSSCPGFCLFRCWTCPLWVNSGHSAIYSITSSARASSVAGSDAKRLGCLQIYDELEFGRLLNRYFAGFFPLENTTSIGSCLSKLLC